MEAVYSKQLVLINKYKSISESDEPNRNEALDVKQEINRQYHILNHILRAQFNYAGKFLVASIFGMGGLMYGLSHIPIANAPSLRKTIPLVLGCTFASSVVGYMYARKFLSRKDDASINYKRLNNFRKEYDPQIKEYDTIIETKLTQRMI